MFYVFVPKKKFYGVEIRLGNNIFGFYITESIIWEKTVSKNIGEYLRNLTVKF